MKTLLWREFHWNRAIIVAGAVLFLLPYLIALLVLLWPNTDGPDIQDFKDAFGGATLGSFLITQIILTFLGGNAMAGERADRTAEFLAYLPISKLQRLAAKLSLILLVAAFIWGYGGLILVVVFDSVVILPPDRSLAEYTAFTTFVMFGVAWFVSSIQSSPTYAVLAGVVTPFLIMFTIHFVIRAMDASSHELAGLIIETGFTTSCLALGALGLLIGTWCFLKRVEP